MALTYAKLAWGDTTTIPYTPSSSAVTGGDVIVVGNNIFFAEKDIAVGALGHLHIGGVWDLPKEASVAHTQGALVYWDATNHVVTTTAGSNKKIGIVASDAAAADTRGKYLSIDQAA